MAKKDYKALAAGIIEKAGGAGNIASVTHCMTRLRLVLRDKSKFDTDAVKQVPGVLNVIIQNGEYQVVIGQEAALRMLKLQPRIWHRITAISATLFFPSSVAPSARSSRCWLQAA